MLRMTEIPGLHADPRGCDGAQKSEKGEKDEQDEMCDKMPCDSLGRQWCCSHIKRRSTGATP